jgi:hypothetical protein
MAPDGRPEGCALRARTDARRRLAPRNKVTSVGFNVAQPRGRFSAARFCASESAFASEPTTLENVMKRTWISAAAAAAISVVSAAHAWSQEKQPNQAPAAQRMQKDRDPPPGAENMNKRAERMQSASPMSEGQGQKPAGKSSSD